VAVDPLVKRLARLGTCAVSDALDRLGLKGTVQGIHAVWPSGRIAGRTVTVKLKQEAPGERSEHHLGARAVDAASASDVIVIANDGRDFVSGWGGLLSLGAHLKGVRGVVVDGACRDVDESRQLGLPVFARGAVPTTARGRVIEEATNIAVQVAHVTVNPGDLVIADGSGVVFIAAGRAEEVISTAEELAATEASFAQAIRAGHSMVEAMGPAYESMLAREGSQ